MFFSITGRRLGHVLPRSAAITRRVDQVARASYSIAASNGASSSQNSQLSIGGSFTAHALPFRTIRRLATGQAASRPKAHTGRASSKRTTTKTTTKSAKATKPKPKKAPAKKKPKARRVKKELTPEEKKKAQNRTLKPIALRTPKQLPATAYLVLATQESKTTIRSEGVKSAAQQASQRYKNLSPSEREQLNHIAQQNKSKNDEAYKQWVQSMSPADIHRANLARRQLTRNGVKGYSRRIVDDRLPKRPVTARVLFVKERWASGELAGIKPADALRLVSEEWKRLPEAEKQQYAQSAAQDGERFRADYQRAFGKPYVARATRAASV